MSLKRLSCFVVCVFLLLTTLNSYCQEYGTGLETGGDKRIYVMVEPMSDKSKKIGLTENLLKTKVGLRLRQNGLVPVDEMTSFELGYYLYVNTFVVGSAYYWDVTFMRMVEFSVDDKLYWTMGGAWESTGLGTHASDVKNIFEAALDSVDIFCNEFLSVNSP